MDEDDYWAEKNNVDRLSTKIPGLGNKTGSIDLNACRMKEAAKDVADFYYRARHPYIAYFTKRFTHYKGAINDCNPL